MSHIRFFAVASLCPLLFLFPCVDARSFAVASHGVWGLRNHAKIKPSSPQKERLDSLLLQTRGGSTYPGDRDYGRYDSYGDYQDDYGDDRRGDRGYDEYYDDRGRSNSPSSPNPLSSLTSKIRNGDRRLGFALLGLGTTFTVLGVSLFFNKALMRLGNLMLIAGVPVSVGPSRTAGYLLKPEKVRATACLIAGIFLVFVGWPILGIALEVFGVLNIFGNMFPMVWAIAKTLPGFSALANLGGGGGGSSSYKRQSTSYRDYDYERDPYGDDDPGYDRDSYYNDDRRGYNDYRDNNDDRYY